MDSDKIAFLQNDCIPLLESLDPSTKPLWGLMNAQQMVEHLSRTVHSANGKTAAQIFTAPDILPKVRAFMLSDKPFRENTKNTMLADVPAPIKNASYAEALHELSIELKDMFAFFAANPDAITVNPIFGELNYAENIHLLRKHVLHHLRQFGLVAAT